MQRIHLSSRFVFESWICNKPARSFVISGHLNITWQPEHLKEQNTVCSVFGAETPGFCISTDWATKKKPAFRFARVLVMFSLALVRILRRVFEQLVNSRAVTKLRYTRCNTVVLMAAAAWLIPSFSSCIVRGFDSYTVLFKCSQRKYLPPPNCSHRKYPSQRGRGEIFSGAVAFGYCINFCIYAKLRTRVTFSWPTLYIYVYIQEIKCKDIDVQYNKFAFRSAPRKSTQKICNLNNFGYVMHER